jgi:hypothetical protein
MRAAILALVAAGTLSAMKPTPAKAWGEGGYPSRYPICLHTLYGDNDCSFTNYQQCMWAGSGLGETCFANPAMAYSEPYVEEPAPAPRRRARHRRDY